MNAFADQEPDGWVELSLRGSSGRDCLGLPAAVRELYRRTIAAGRGAESPTVLDEMINPPALRVRL